jgi:hypothetical protein
MDETRHDIDTQDFGAVPGPATRPQAGTRMDGHPSSMDDVTVRFGPGVSPRLAGVWRDSGPRRRPLYRRIVAGLVTVGVAVLSGLVVWFLLRSGPEVQVTGVTVSAPSGVQQCGATTTLVGVIHTNGGQGDVAYRWRRSDGQNSAVFTDSAPKGKHSIRVPLRWTVKGPGSLHAVATLEVISPESRAHTASAGFTYECR